MLRVKDVNQRQGNKFTSRNQENKLLSRLSVNVNEINQQIPRCHPPFDAKGLQ